MEFKNELIKMENNLMKSIYAIIKTEYININSS